jgi:hypothetical protein
MTFFFNLASRFAGLVSVINLFVYKQPKASFVQRLSKFK